MIFHLICIYLNNFTGNLIIINLIIKSLIISLIYVTTRKFNFFDIPISISNNNFLKFSITVFYSQNKKYHNELFKASLMMMSMIMSCMSNALNMSCETTVLISRIFHNTLSTISLIECIFTMDFVTVSMLPSTILKWMVNLNT